MLKAALLRMGFKWCEPRRCWIIESYPEFADDFRARVKLEMTKYTVTEQLGWCNCGIQSVARDGRSETETFKKIIGG